MKAEGELLIVKFLECFSDTVHRNLSCVLKENEKNGIPSGNVHFLKLSMSLAFFKEMFDSIREEFENILQVETIITDRDSIFIVKHLAEVERSLKAIEGAVDSLYINDPIEEDEVLDSK